MSASLVGSEMCIRDRYTLGAGRTITRQHSTKLGEAHRGPTTQALRTPASVSYTHLTLPTICSV
eukprot:14058901-Alexandrium_andersonii.AAC.1